MAKRPRLPKASQNDHGQSSAAPPGYAIGRGRPPVHSRFKPGQPGNPKGRRKGARNKRSTSLASESSPKILTTLTPANEVCSCSVQVIQWRNVGSVLLVVKTYCCTAVTPTHCRDLHTVSPRTPCHVSRQLLTILINVPAMPRGKK